MTSPASGSPHGAPVRRVVRDSWDRATRRRLDPDGLPLLELPEDDLDDWRLDHPLAAALPVIRRLLVDDAEGSGLLVAVGDESGRLLWVEGDSTARRQAESMLFVAGAGWSEARVGTSAPGTALVLDHGVQIRGEEHWNHRVQAWSCTAVPIHDPADGHVIGVLDITGDERAAGSQTLPLVTATAAAVEAHLALLRWAADGDARALTPTRASVRPRRPVRTPAPAPAPAAATAAGPTVAASDAVGASSPDRSPAPARLSVLGRDGAVLAVGGRRVVLSARHSEIMLLLAHRSEGYGAADLADAVYGDVDAVTTLRPEMVRLRHVIEAVDPSLVPLSRPYRSPRSIGLDLDEQAALVGRGAHRAAVRADRGSALPSSTAPGVVELREETRAALRDAVLVSGSAETLVAFADAPTGHDDERVLHELLRRLAPHSPRRPGVVTRLETLERRRLDDAP